MAEYYQFYTLRIFRNLEENIHQNIQFPILLWKKILQVCGSLRLFSKLFQKVDKYQKKLWKNLWSRHVFIDIAFYFHSSRFVFLSHFFSFYKRNLRCSMVKDMLWTFFRSFIASEALKSCTVVECFSGWLLC